MKENKREGGRERMYGRRRNGGRGRQKLNCSISDTLCNVYIYVHLPSLFFVFMLMSHNTTLPLVGAEASCASEHNTRTMMSTNFKCYGYICTTRPVCEGVVL